ncbi:MAG TPA: hypothetical protein VIM34_13120 [Burkholderiaceae bacterium]
MTYFASCFLVALLATLFIMRPSMRQSHLSVDHDLSGPQKFHGRLVPRVGSAGGHGGDRCGRGDDRTGYDDFNGLASMCVLMMVRALGYVAFQVNDTFIFTAALITAGAVLGFRSESGRSSRLPPSGLPAPNGRLPLMSFVRHSLLHRAQACA